MLLTPTKPGRAFHELMTSPPTLPDNLLKDMAKAIELKTRVDNSDIPDDTDGNEATCVQFLGGVFEHVVGKYQKHHHEGLTIGVQTQLTGELVKGDGIIDFLITDSKKKGCVVKVK
jgi:hypothetical protein